MRPRHAHIHLDGALLGGEPRLHHKLALLAPAPAALLPEIKGDLHGRDVGMWGRVCVGVGGGWGGGGRQTGRKAGALHCWAQCQ